MPLRALIIGGGIGGVAAGIALRQAGWNVAVFERAPAFREVGAGITLWANAVKALDQLGVGTAVRSGGWAEGSPGIWTWRGRPLMKMPADEMERLTGAPSVALHRAELLDLLADALGREHIRLGRRCLGFVQTPNGVAARFDDGSVESGDVLIGADGLRSTVRAELFGDQPPKYAGYIAWRGIVPFALGNHPVGEFLGRGRRFGIVPLRGGRVYWFATANLPLNAPPSARGEQAELLARFSDWCDPIPELIRQTEPAAILCNEICDRDPISRWGDRRVTLLGDAAHPMTPNMGQGGCQAIEDAVVLGRCLSGIANPQQIPEALRRYESLRTARTKPIVLFSRRWGMFSQVESALACGFRDAMLRFTPKRLQSRQIAAMINRFN